MREPVTAIQELVQSVQKSVLLHLFCVRCNVAPDDVSPFRLEVPRGNEYNVIVADPHPPLYLASYPARSHLAVCALYYDVVAANELDNSA